MLEKYEEYKNINTSWLHSIPKNWVSVKIGELFEERKVKVSDKKYAPLTVGKMGVVPQLSTVAKSNDSDNRKLVKSGDYVINSRSDRKGSSGLSSLDGSVSLINIVLTPREGNGKYYHYLLRSYYWIEEYYRNGRGIVADLWTTRFSEMKSIVLPLPPNPEQNQIVRYLDWKVSIINKYINAKKKQIELLKERKQAIINQAVTKGLDINVPMKESGIEWLGKIPAHWSIRRLKTLTSLSNQKRTGNISQYVGLENIESWTGKHIITKNIEAQSVCNIFKKGNLLFGKLRPYLAKSWIAEYDGVCSSEFLVMCNIKINLNYLHSFFKLKSFIFHIDSSTYGAKMPRANWDFIGNCKLPVPPYDEQERISVFCQENSTNIENYCIKLQQQINILQEYRTRLISDVVTGRVNIQNVKVPEFEEENEKLSGNEQEENADIYP